MWALTLKRVVFIYLFVYLFIVLLRQGLTTEPKLALNLKQSSCLDLMTAGITVMPHHSQSRTLMGKS